VDQQSGVDRPEVERKGAIVWAVPPTHATNDEVDRVLAQLAAELRVGVPYVLIFDLTRSALPTAVQRRKLTAHMRDNAEKIRRWVRGIGIVCPNPLMRGAVTAIFWVAPPPVPHHLFATCKEASDWADSLIKAAPRR
jgi:hypothetical protein